jgi:competence ComEA-like helix-hairpin-helix protein
MSISRILAGVATLSLLAAPVLAQTAQPAQPNQPSRASQPAQPAQPTQPARPAQPAQAQPAQPARPAQPAQAQPAQPAQPAARTTAPAAATQTQGQKINLNTANEAELDKLPQIGPARAKAIIENRTKNGRFKDWNDFVARGVVPSNAEAAIKDLVRF